MKKFIITITIISNIIFVVSAYATKFKASNNYHDLTNYYYIITSKEPSEQNLLKSLKYSHTNRYSDAKKYSGISEFHTALDLIDFIPNTNSEIRKALIDLHSIYGDKYSAINLAIYEYDKEKGVEILSNVVANTKEHICRRMTYSGILARRGILLGYPLIEEGLCSPVSIVRSSAEELLNKYSHYEKAITDDGYIVDTAHLLKIARQNTNAYIVAAQKGNPIEQSHYLHSAEKNLWANDALQIITNNFTPMTNRLHLARLACSKNYYFGHELIEPGLKSNDRNVKIAAEKLLSSYLRLDGAPLLTNVKCRINVKSEIQKIDSMKLLDIAESNSCITISKDQISEFREGIKRQREFWKNRNKTP